MNTTSRPLTDVRIEATVWGLDGSKPYHHIENSITVPVKKTLAVFEMGYPTAKDAQPVYFFLLKLFSGKTLLSRNFYWLHLPGGDYTALEAYRAQKAPLRLGMTSTLTGRACQLHVVVENASLELPTKSHAAQEMYAPEKSSLSSCLWSNVCPCFGSKASKLFPEQAISSQERGRVAFWLHLSVVYDGEAGEETRILPVNYTQNYFSLTPGEKMEVEVSFEAPESITKNPSLVLSGWNTQQTKLALSLQ